MDGLKCQKGDVLAPHGAVEQLRWRLTQGLGIRSGLAAALRRRGKVAARFGKPSQHLVGSWVRVRDRAAIEATLDAAARLRGLVWVPSQWDACGGVFRVQKQVRRIVDDAGRMRAVSGTVLLDGCDCGGETGDAGCGRHCPLMFRDEWLEAADPPAEAPAERRTAGRRARVRSVASIRSTLDRGGRRDGVQFTPEMEHFAGSELPVLRRLDRVFELDRWCAPRASLYLLQGAHCPGGGLGKDGPCDRACALVWHEDWLEVGSDAAA